MQILIKNSLARLSEYFIINNCVSFFPLFLISLCLEGFNHIQICKLNDIGAQSNLFRAKKYYYKQRLSFISALEIYQPQFCLYELKLVNFSFHKFLRKVEDTKKADINQYILEFSKTTRHFQHIHEWIHFLDYSQLLQCL